MTGFDRPAEFNVQCVPAAPPHRNSGGADEFNQQLSALLPRLWRFALRLAGNRHDAEDIVQCAYARARERRYQLPHGTSTLSWLFSLVHSVWLNEVRARHITGYASLEWSEELADTPAETSMLTLEMDRLHRQVVSAVGKLPDAQRAVMLLVAVEGLSYHEAAEVLDVATDTVMSRVACARLTISETFGATQRWQTVGKLTGGGIAAATAPSSPALRARN